MELTQAQLNSLQALTVSSGKIKTDNLAVGQQISAKIVAVDPKTGEVSLKLNDAVVAAKMASTKALLQLAAGQTVQLTVAQTNANKVVLQLPTTLLDAVTQQKALREALPKQQPVTDAIIQLKALIKQTGTTESPRQLPESIAQFAKKLVSQLPTPTQLSTPAGVKQAIKQSGVFLENKFSNILQGNTKTSLEGDIKGLLLGLKSTLLKEKNALPSQPATSGNKTPLTEIKAGINPANNTARQIQSNAPLLKLLNSNSIQSLSPTNITSTPFAKATNENLAQNLPAELSEQVKYKKILDIRSIESSITEAIKNTGNNLPTDKQLTDKQIQQILSNLLGQRKSPNNSISNSTANRDTPTLPPLPNAQVASKPTSTIPTPMMHYATKETITARNEIAMAAIKSQHVSEASTPRINNLVDLIETLIKQVDSAISRTQVHQLNAMHDQESGKLAFSMEIPVNDDDDLHLIQLEIEKEQNKENETETVVTVNLAIDLNSIGPVYARITLINDNTSIVLWAERDSTFSLVQESVDVLQTKLVASGLKPDGIACHHGQPPQSRFVKAQDIAGLVDERA